MQITLVYVTRDPGWDPIEWTVDVPDPAPEPPARAILNRGAIGGQAGGSSIVGSGRAEKCCRSDWSGQCWLDAY